MYDQNFYGGAELREVTVKDACSGVGILSKTTYRGGGRGRRGKARHCL